MHGCNFAEWRVVRSEADHATDARCSLLWVNMLCVNLDDAAMRHAETAKQAAIFGNVKAAILYWRRLLPHTKYALAYSLIVEGSEARINLAWKCALALYHDG